MSTVSVCIVMYNSAGDIDDCLNAIFKQLHPIERVVIVDNASTDGSVEIVKQRIEHIDLILNKVNNGFAGGQNQAIAAANSDYVLVLNPDVILKPSYVSEIIAVMEQNPAVGSATGQLALAFNPEQMDSAGLAIKWNRQVFDLAAGEPVTQWNRTLEVFGVSGAAAVYRTSMIRDISYEGQFFDETFFAYKEDVDVAWRAQLLGWKALYVPAAKAIHGRGWKKRGRFSIPLFVRRHSYQNRIFTLIKNEYYGLHLLYRIPLLVISEGIKFGYICVREPGLLACWITIIRRLPEMLRKRKWLMQRMANRVKHRY